MRRVRRVRRVKSRWFHSSIRFSSGSIFVPRLHVIQPAQALSRFSQLTPPTPLVDPVNAWPKALRLDRRELSGHYLRKYRDNILVRFR